MIEIPKSPDEVSDLPKKDFTKFHQSAIIDLNKKYDRPPLCISIGVDDRSYKGVNYPLRFGTFGNISMIKGEEKARKSFLKSLIIANAIGGQSNHFTGDLEICGYGLQDKWILDIDTEQDDYDAWLNAIRIPNMVGQTPDNYRAIKLRDKTSVERLEYVEWLFMESEFRNNIGLTSIDGFVDLVKDFNSNVESIEFTEKLMKWSSVSKSHIMGVLHLNPGTEKARGHLGTILQNKCETVTIIKDMGEYSVVKCQRARGKRFPEFGITVNDDWLPFISNYPIENNEWLP